MALKVTRSDEVIRVETLCFTIYSQPGVGKTSLSFTASKPLLLDFDKGAHRAVDRKDVVQVSDWRDVAGITAADVAQYDTIIIDTVGKALDCLSQDIIRDKPKLGYGGALNMQGWGQLGIRFSAYLKLLRSFGKDVVLIAHMDEKSDGDQIKERLKIGGGTKDLVTTDSDVIARLSIANRQRLMSFSPSETTFGKDPAAIGELAIPDRAAPEFKDFLASVINRIKDGLNTLSEDQIARQAEIEAEIAERKIEVDTLCETLSKATDEAELAAIWEAEKNTRARIYDAAPAEYERVKKAASDRKHQLTQKEAA